MNLNILLERNKVISFLATPSIFWYILHENPVPMYRERDCFYHTIKMELNYPSRNPISLIGDGI